MDPLHYINFGRDANSYDQQRDCKSCNGAVEGIAWYVQVLKSPDAPRNEKRTALRFLAHLIGDIHQPLYAGFAEDRGGNSVEVRLQWQQREPALLMGHGARGVGARHPRRDRITYPSCGKRRE